MFIQKRTLYGEGKWTTFAENGTNSIPAQMALYEPLSNHIIYFYYPTSNMQPCTLPHHPFTFLQFPNTPDLFAFPTTALYDPSNIFLPI